MKQEEGQKRENRNSDLSESLIENIIRKTIVGFYNWALQKLDAGRLLALVGSSVRVPTDLFHEYSLTRVSSIFNTHVHISTS